MPEKRRAPLSRLRGELIQSLLKFVLFGLQFHQHFLHLQALLAQHGHHGGGRCRAPAGRSALPESESAVAGPAGKELFSIFLYLGDSSFTILTLSYI